MSLRSDVYFRDIESFVDGQDPAFTKIRNCMSQMGIYHVFQAAAFLQGSFEDQKKQKIKPRNFGVALYNKLVKKFNDLGIPFQDIKTETLAELGYAHGHIEGFSPEQTTEILGVLPELTTEQQRTRASAPSAYAA